MVKKVNKAFKVHPKAQHNLIQFLKTAKAMYLGNWDIRTRLEQNDLAYIRELDYTNKQNAAKAKNATGNSDAIQNITVPIVMPQVETAVNYQTSVFLTQAPLFGVATSPDYVDVGIQLETVIGKQAKEGKWVSAIQKTLRDGFKHNLGFLEVDWTTKKFSSVGTLANGEVGATQETWAGNTCTHLDLYNCFWDTRVAPTEVSEKGEFFGYTEKLSRVMMKEYINNLEEKIKTNTKAALEAPEVNDYYIPQLLAQVANPGNSQFHWMSWITNSTGVKSTIDYKDSYERTTLYARLIPNDLGLAVPQANTPQIWKIVIVNNCVVIFAEKLNNAHGRLPVLGIQPNEDGLGYQTKSLAQNVAPMQSVSSALLNSVLDARRRAIYDRAIYDPTRIDSKAVNSANPIANIPLKPSAYGTDVRQAYTQIPFNDNQAGVLLGEINTINGMADTITGQNKAQQGQFVKGNKTQDEFSTVMSNADGRSAITSLLLEDQFFTPLKTIIKTNILQYQGAESLYSAQTKAVVPIDPVALRNAVLEFKVTDGLLPASKLLNLSAFQSALQVLGSSPQLAAPYELGKLLSYLFKSQGANISDFEKPQEQLSYEQAVQQWQQVAMSYAEQGIQFTVPQPKPQDYGWDGNKTVTKPKQEEPKGLLEQVMAIDNPQSQGQGQGQGKTNPQNSQPTQGV